MLYELFGEYSNIRIRKKLLTFIICSLTGFGNLIMEEITEFIPKNPLNTAVLFLIFNRLDTTKQVFEAIRKAKPPRIYIAADGPRENRPDDIKNIQGVRDYVLSSIDWNCEVKTLFRDENLGCKYAVSGAITWFFENEEKGIILEDDCLPSQSFFWFCEDLLDIYEDDLRVGQISGFNYGYEEKGVKYDYFFSKYPQIWGWASWKNRWQNYDVEISILNEIIGYQQLKQVLSKGESKQKLLVLKKVHQGLIDTWDYQWSLTQYINRQYSIIPRINLIKNLGFNREDAVHTKGKDPYGTISYDNSLILKMHPKYILELQSYYDLITQESIISRIRAEFK